MTNRRFSESRAGGRRVGEMVIRYTSPTGIRDLTQWTWRCRVDVAEAIFVFTLLYWYLYRRVMTAAAETDGEG